MKIALGLMQHGDVHTLMVLAIAGEGTENLGNALCI